MLTYFELEPNTIFPEHAHEAEQTTLVLEGELTFTIQGQKSTLGPGDVISIPSHLKHGAYTTNHACRAVDAWSPVRKDWLKK
ncbi:cupin domain-containing protein [candidate division FCPU426 bacterium]|nr:cupin domain-containing protein [candidate division FCPU426 bacterium]